MPFLRTVSCITRSKTLHFYFKKHKAYKSHCSQYKHF